MSLNIEYLYELLHWRPGSKGYDENVTSILENKYDMPHSHEARRLIDSKQAI